MTWPHAHAQAHSVTFTDRYSRYRRDAAVMGKGPILFTPNAESLVVMETFYCEWAGLVFWCVSWTIGVRPCTHTQVFIKLEGNAVAKMYINTTSLNLLNFWENVEDCLYIPLIRWFIGYQSNGSQSTLAEIPFLGIPVASWSLSWLNLSHVCCSASLSYFHKTVKYCSV